MMICKTFKLTWIWTCKIPVMHDFLLQTLTLAERKQSESVVLGLGVPKIRGTLQVGHRGYIGGIYGII